MTKVTRDFLVLLVANLIFWAIVGLIAFGVLFGHPWITWIGLGFLAAVGAVGIVVALGAGAGIGVMMLRDNSQRSCQATAIRWVFIFYFLGGPVFIVCASLWLWFRS